MLSRAAGIVLTLSIAANLGLGLAYRHALIKQGEIRALAQAEAAEAANERLAGALARQQSAYEQELQALRDARAREETLTAEAVERAQTAERALRNFDTSRLSDTSEDYEVWRKTEVPSSVVTRLRGLQ